MGRWSDNIRRKLNPKKQAFIESKRKLELNDDAQIVTRDQLKNPHKLYFLRVKKNGIWRYVKFCGGYMTEENSIGACIFNYKEGMQFIKDVSEEIPELEMIPMDEVIPKSKSV